MPNVVKVSPVAFSTIIYLNEAIVNWGGRLLIVVIDRVSVVWSVRRRARWWAGVGLALSAYLNFLSPLLVRLELDLTHHNTRVVTLRTSNVHTLGLTNTNLWHELFPFFSVLVVFATAVYNPALSGNFTACRRDRFKCFGKPWFLGEW